MMNESKEPTCSEAREFWEAAVRLWEESGLSVRDFCGREGLGESSFHAWRRRFRSEGPVAEPNAKPLAKSSAMPEKVSLPQGRRQAIQRSSVSESKRAAAVEFLPVHVVSEGVRVPADSFETLAGAASIEIVGPSPWRVRIPADFDPTTFDAVLTALERRPC